MEREKRITINIQNLVGCIVMSSDKVPEVLEKQITEALLKVLRSVEKSGVTTMKGVLKGESPLNAD